MSGAERRVVLTGMGVRAPGGHATAGFWELLTTDRTATRTITAFDPRRSAPGSPRRSTSTQARRASPRATPPSGTG